MDGPTRIKKLILDGEGLTLDFKKTISNYEILARPITALANTCAGKRLVRVEESGDVAGVSSEEEAKFMPVVAGNDYFDPLIVPRFEEVYADNRMVLLAGSDESTSK